MLQELQFSIHNRLLKNKGGRHPCRPRDVFQAKGLVWVFRVPGPRESLILHLIPFWHSGRSLQKSVGLEWRWGTQEVLCAIATGQGRSAGVSARSPAPAAWGGIIPYLVRPSLTQPSVHHQLVPTAMSAQNISSVPPKQLSHELLSLAFHSLPSLSLLSCLSLKEKSKTTSFCGGCSS